MGCAAIFAHIIYREALAGVVLIRQIVSKIDALTAAVKAFVATA